MKRRKMEQKNECHCENFLTGLVLGVILGAGLFYFLTSTEKGKEIEKNLNQKTKTALRDLKDLVEEIEEKGEEFKEKFQQTKAELEEKAGQPLLSQMEKLRKRGHRAIKFFTKNGKSLV